MIRLRIGTPLVQVQRSGVIESRHCGHLLIREAGGNTRLSLGDPHQPIFSRSCMKPLQAVAMVRAGFDGTRQELALAAASHSGSAAHRALIAESLTSSGLTPQDLGCPADLPIGQAEQWAYLRAGEMPSRLAMNCSGKHAAMLRTCLVNGWEIADYLNPAHPLQVGIAATVADLAAEQIAATGVDGCGAPVLAISLHGLARAFSLIAAGTEPAAAKVAEAMRRHPDLVGGDGRLNTVLMQRIPGLIAKDGAEGCFAAALADGGCVALKIDDGSSRAAQAGIIAALRHLGIDNLADLALAPVLGGGIEVGAVSAVF